MLYQYPGPPIKNIPFNQQPPIYPMPQQPFNHNQNIVRPPIPMQKGGIPGHQQPLHPSPFMPPRPNRPPIHHIIEHFKTEDGNVDFNKVLTTANQVSDTVKQVSPLIKQMSPLLKMFTKV